MKFPSKCDTMLIVIASMYDRSGEVEFLLRRPMNNDEDITGTLAAAEAGLQFLDEVFLLNLWAVLPHIGHLYFCFSVSIMSYF